MRPDLTKRLFDTFPDLYQQHSLGPTQSNMLFGFECGDGWFDVVWDLSKALSEKCPSVQATQVKEKYGGLRFYYYADELDAALAETLVTEAEDRASVTCEVCGLPGTLRTRGWWKVTCEEHKT